LAEGSQPPKKQPSVTANRSQRNARRRKKTNPLLLVIPLLLVAGAVALFAFTRGGEAKIPFIGGGGDEPVPAFDFPSPKVGVETTSEKTDTKSLRSAAEKAAAEAAPVIDQLYTEAFLDPNNWKDGEYDEVWEVFDPSALPSAEASIETLTLGVSAGDVYETVEPEKGKLKMRVLFDENGGVISIVALVEFEAFGARQDGTYTNVVSNGQFFLRDGGDGWKIYSFDAKRLDEEAPPPKPAPSVSASPSASA
jgi:hypothetical protein